MGVLSSLVGGLSGGSGTSHSEQAGGGSSASINSAQSTGSSQSRTYGTEATQAAINAANVAYNRQLELANMQMKYNAEEAQKQRDWETEMANSVYTRSVENMKAAGINPILAAGFGLSGASVGSGATASISGMSAPVAQTFADQSASSVSQSSSYGESNGSSWNSGFSDSLYGIQAAVDQTKGVVDGLVDATQSAKVLEKVEDLVGKGQETGKKVINSITDYLKDAASKVFGKGGGGAGHKF